MSEANVPAMNMPKASLGGFKRFVQENSTSRIIGKLIKFSKGDWTVGQEETPVAATDRFVVLLDQATHGWTKWQDKKPVAQVMGLIADEKFTKPKRNELGDLEEEFWDVDTNGQPRDPWQETSTLILRKPGSTGSDDDMFTFSTASAGGRSAVADLCVKFVNLLQEKGEPGFPIVVLETSSYKHSNKDYGKIKTPVFKVVGWEPIAAPMQQIEHEADEEEDEAPAPKKARGKK